MANQLANDPNGIQVVAFSGGAQAFSMAAQSGQIGQDALQNITHITYLSPGLGLGGQLYMGPDTTVWHGHGIKDFGATLFARLSGALSGHTGLPCSHNFGCEYNAHQYQHHYRRVAVFQVVNAALLLAVVERWRIRLLGQRRG